VATRNVGGWRKQIRLLHQCREPGLVGWERSMASPLERIASQRAALAGGVLFATFITLMMIPCGYLVLEDIKRAAGRILRRPQPALEAVGTGQSG